MAEQLPIPPISCLFGSLTGLVKEINLLQGQGNIRYGTPTAGAYVVSLLRGRHKDELIVARKDVVIVMINFVPFLTVTGFKEAVVAADLVETKEGHLSLMCITEGGSLHLVELDTSGSVDVSTLGEPLMTSKPVEAVFVPPDCRRVVAVAGNENRLRLWDLWEKRVVYEARNPPHDWLSLRVPVWTSGVFVFPGMKVVERDFEVRQKDGTLLRTERRVVAEGRVATCTRQNQLMMFDTTSTVNVGRPVWQKGLGESPLTCIAPSGDFESLHVGSASGFIYSVHATSGKMLGRMRPSCMGSVRSLKEVVADERYLVACGFDRFVYVYRLETRALRRKIYAKLQLNSLLVLNEEELAAMANAKENSSSDDEDEDDDMDDGHEHDDDDDDDDDDKDNNDSDDDNWLGLKEQPNVKKRSMEQSSAERALEKLRERAGRKRHHHK